MSQGDPDHVTHHVKAVIREALLDSADLGVERRADTVHRTLAAWHMLATEWLPADD